MERPIRIAAADGDAAWRGATDAEDALAEHYGECQEGHRSTDPKALAAFDLDQPDWPARFTAPLRVRASLAVKKPEPARAAFIAFRDAEFAARAN